MVAQRRCVAVVLWVALVCGCASVNTQQYKSAVFSLEKFALVSLYGPAEITVPYNRSDEHLMNAKDLRKQTPRLAHEAVVKLRELLDRTLRLKVLGHTRVVDHAAYKQLPADPQAGELQAPDGFKPLAVDQGSNAALGELAQALDVDAVVVVRMRWELEVEEEEREVHEKGYATAQVVVVDAQGKRLVDSSHTGYSTELRRFREKKDGLDIGVSLFGTGNEGKQYEAVQEAVYRSLEAFASTWMEKRPADG